MGAYTELARLIEEGKVTGDVQARLLIQLQLDMMGTLRDTAAYVKAQDNRLDKIERRLDALESAPSFARLFRSRPAQFIGVVVAVHAILDGLLRAMPALVDMIAALLKIV